MFAIEVKELRKYFNEITAINNINLEIEKGEIIGIIGPDAAGKTTLLRLITGLLHPTSGNIFVNGINVFRNPKSIKENLGYMPQRFSLYGDLSVSENLKFFARLYGVKKKEFKLIRKELLDFSGLAPFENRLARNLSGGMQKKLALACNLFHSPEILLLDEPTTGIDPISRKEFWSLLSKLNRQGTTIVLTTPYMDEAQKCHRVGLMFEGKILDFNSPESIIRKIKDEVIELRTECPLREKPLSQLPYLKNMYHFGETLHLVFEPGKGAEYITKEFLEKQGIIPITIKRISPSFEDAFFSLVKRQ